MAATRIFFGMKKILFLAKVIEFSNRENTYNYIARTNFNRDFSYSFWDKYLKLGSYVLGTKTKQFIELIFDFGLKSENIEFWTSGTYFFIVRIFAIWKCNNFGNEQHFFIPKKIPGSYHSLL